jgi:hypothetical protein
VSNTSSNTDTFVVENCILRYPHLFQAQQVQGKGEPKFSAKLYLDAETAGMVHQKAQELAMSHFKNGEPQLANFAWPVTAANMKPADAAIARLADKYIMNAKASVEYPPAVVDEQRQPIMDRGKIYSGCMVAVGIRLYTYNNMGNIGIGVGLSAVMKTGDGEPIADGSPDPNTLFANVQAQVPTGTPAPGGAPMPGGTSAQPGTNANVQQPAMPGLPSFDT